MNFYHLAWALTLTLGIESTPEITSSCVHSFMLQVTSSRVSSYVDPNDHLQIDLDLELVPTTFIS